MPHSERKFQSKETTEQLFHRTWAELKAAVETTPVDLNLVDRRALLFGCAASALKTKKKK